MDVISDLQDHPKAKPKQDPDHSIEKFKEYYDEVCFSFYRGLGGA